MTAPVSRASPVARLTLAAVPTIAANVVLCSVAAAQRATSYAEPKVFALQTTGWLFLVWLVGSRKISTAALVRTLANPFCAAFLLLLLYALTSRSWALFSPNHFFVWNQWLLTFALAVAVCAWAQDDHRIRRGWPLGLFVSLLPTLAISGLQLAGAELWLQPIDPGYGVRNPSLMGYKNPMALAVLGHFCLLAGLWLGVRRSRAVALGLSAIGAFELYLLAGLQSRTAMVALAATTMAIGLLFLARHRRESHLRAHAITAPLALGLVLVGFVYLQPQARKRLLTLRDLIAQPAGLWESDRGIYLRNTLHMATLEPLGVGLGNWQVVYPVMRKSGRDLAFDDRVQVRRAHNDHAQILGELGWPGLVLWLSAWIWALAAGARRYWRSGQALDLALWALVFAWTLAMACDYLYELPWHRLVLMSCGVWISTPAPRSRETAVRSRDLRSPSPAPSLAVTVLLLVAGFQTGTGAAALARSHLGLQIRQHYALARSLWLVAPRTAEAHAAAAIEAGRRYLWLPGITQTSFQIHLRAAEASLWLERPEVARVHLQQGLALHPLHPPVFRNLARLAELEEKDPAHCFETHHHLMHEALAETSLQEAVATVSEKRSLCLQTLQSAGTTISAVTRPAPRNHESRNTPSLRGLASALVSPILR